MTGGTTTANMACTHGVQVTGVVPGQCQVFRSAMYPVMVTFYVKDNVRPGG